GDLGQTNPEGRARAGLALHFDGPAALLDDAVDGRQTEPRAFAFFLRREERLEDLRHDLGGHSRARVGDREPHVTAGRSAGTALTRISIEFDLIELDVNPASRGHRIAGVDDQVDEHLLDLTGIAAYASEAGLTHEGELDVFANQPAQHVFRLRDDLFEREDLRHQHLTTAEEEELTRQAGRTVGRVDDLAGVGPPRVVFVQGFEEQFAIPPDRREQVVEVVGNAPGEAA